MHGTPRTPYRSSLTQKAMADQNLSAVLYKKRDLGLEDRPIPEPGHGEVQIAVSVVGICGSDVHFYRDGGTNKSIVTKPMILGHESGGIVTKLGSGVTSLRVGDRVTVEPAVPCAQCKFCKIGRYNICNQARVAFPGTPRKDGLLARFYVHSADYCYKLPDNVSFEEASLLEPLSVAIHSCRRGGVELGDTVFVCGAGAVGLLCMMVAKVMGAARVCITDISESRLAMARQLGATETVLVTSGDSAEAVAESVGAKLGRKPDITLECSGAKGSLQAAIYATETGGTVVVVGNGPIEVSLPIVEAAVREVDIKGVFRYANCYPTALAMVSSRQINVQPLVTHRFKLEDSVEAFETATTGKDGAIKVMIHCDRDWKGH